MIINAKSILAMAVTATIFMLWLGYEIIQTVQNMGLNQ